MPRPERPIDPSDGTVQRFAAELRSLRARAGNPGYREMAGRVGYSVTSLSDAAGGRRLPGLRLTLAYVQSCGGDLDEWEARWRQSSAELAAQRQPADDHPSGEPPYQGLTYFEEQDATRFFGREALVDVLLRRLAGTRFLTVFGPSGSGKSSLLRAGLIPAVAQRTDPGGPPPVVFTPGSQPMRHLPVSGTDGLLVVDQFEEVFTLCHDPAERERFISRLLDMAYAPRATQVVLAIRSDFFANCAQHPRLAAALAEATMLVGPMSDEELVLAVTGPAKLAGLTVERALIAQVLADAKGQPGALPLLSHALLETWRLRRSTTLTLADYLAAGGISGAIARTAEQVYEDFDPHQRSIARQILIRLTALGEGTEDTRRRVSRDELAFPGADVVIDELVRARLVVMHDTYVEIAHEALIGAWPRLHGWLAEGREGLRLHRQLTDAAGQWEALARDRGTLYRGSRLALIDEWVRHDGHRAGLTAIEKEFLDASLAAELAERTAAERRARQRRMLTASLAVMLVFVVFAAAVAVWQWREAIDQTRQATSRHLAAEAVNVAPTDVAQAMRLSLASYDAAHTTEARSALLSLASRHAYTSRLPLAEPPKDLAFTADGALLATAGQDGQIILWDVAHRTERAHLADGHRGAVRTIAISGHLLASGGRDGSVVLWDLTTLTRLLRLDGGWKRMSSVAFTPDGRVLAALGEEGVIHLWRMPDGRSLGVLPEPGAARSDIAFSPDGRRLAAAGADNTVRVWDLSSLRPAAALRLGMAADAVAFSPDGRHIAVGGEGPDIVVWDTVSGEQSTLRGHTGYVRSLAFDADGSTLVSGGNDEFAVVWDVRDGRALTRLTGHASELYSVAVSPDAQSIATASRDSSVLIYDRGTSPMAGHVDNVTSVAVGPDGRTIASASRDETVAVWDATTRRRLAVLRGHQGRVTDVAFDPRRRFIASTSEDKTVRLWDATTYRPVRTLTVRQPSGNLLSVSFSPDGSLLAASGDDNTVRVWSVVTGELIKQEKYADKILRVLFDDRGSTLVAAAEDGTITVEDIASGATRTLHNASEIASIAVSPGGRFIAVGENHGGITIWDTAGRISGAALPQAHEGTVSALAFSPDGLQLASGSMDKTVMLWDLGRRRLWATLTGHDFDVLGIAWSPDGRILYSGASDRTITPWIVRPADAVGVLCADLYRDFPGVGDDATACGHRRGV